MVAKPVAEAEAEGDIRPDVDPAITARLLFGMVNSLIEWYRSRRDGVSNGLADDAVLVVEETGDLKKGSHAVGCSGSTPARRAD